MSVNDKLRAEIDEKRAHDAPFLERIGELKAQIDELRLKLAPDRMLAVEEERDLGRIRVDEFYDQGVFTRGTLVFCRREKTIWYWNDDSTLSLSIADGVSPSADREVGRFIRVPIEAVLGTPGAPR